MSIFNEEQQNSPADKQASQDGASNPSPDSQHKDPFADLLGTVLNEEGKQKYSSVPEAMKGLAHSQDFIKTLEAENRALKEKLEQAARIEEALQASKSEQQVHQPAGLDEEAISALLDKRLASIKQAETGKTNVQKVVSTLKQRFGEKAEEAFYGKTRELGMTNEEANTLAAKSPEVILALFGSSTPAPRANTSSINTMGMTPPDNTIPTMIDAGEERINLPRGEKSVLFGATGQEQLAELRRHKEAVYKKYGLTI